MDNTEITISKADRMYYEDRIWQKSCRLWVKGQHIRNEKGAELEFKDHSFLQEIYDDESQIITCRKASQIGFSVMMILKSFRLARFKGYNIIYTLPTFQMAQEFVSSKANALISQNKILAYWTKDKDSIFQKKVGNGFIHFRGTSSTKMDKDKSESGVGIMLSSDLNIHDECDRSEQEILEQYESRLQASEFKGRWYFSNPTHPFTLSQGVWDRSDQKHWFIKCEHCNHWQYLDFWKNISNGKFVCEKCKGEISDETRRNGQWVRKYLNRDISGYWISHLIFPLKSAKEIENDFLTKTKQYFYNFVLGLPYMGSDVLVTSDVILRNIDLETPILKAGIVMGVDQGLKKHYVIGNKNGIFKVGVVDTWEEIESFIKQYDIELTIIDALPDLTVPRKLRDKYRGRIWLSYYKREIRKGDFISWDSDTKTVYSDRTKLIQMVIDEMIERKIRFHMKPMDLTEYISAWKGVIKRIEKNSLGIEMDVWETTGDDHLVHATNYWRLGMERVAPDSDMIKWKKEENIDTNLAPEVKKMLQRSGGEKLI